MAEAFRKKPIEVQAVRWTGDNAEEVYAFAGSYFEALGEPSDEDPEATASLCAAPHSSWVLLYTGDWIVRVGPDRFVRCPDVEFRETYEPVGASGKYGDATITTAYGADGKIERYVVERADPVIGMSLELLAQAGWTLPVDESGCILLAGDPRYRYRPVRFAGTTIDSQGPVAVLVCERVPDA